MQAERFLQEHIRENIKVAQRFALMKRNGVITYEIDGSWKDLGLIEVGEY